MKTIYKLRLFVLTIIAMVAGNAFGQDTEYEFEVSGYESFGHFLAGGDSKTFRIRSSNVSWTVECDALWVHISPESGNGSAYVRIDVDPNTEDTERQTIITVNGGPAGIMEFAITQDANVSKFEVSGYENFGVFLAEGDSKSFRVESTNVYWVVTCDSPWVHISPERGSSSASVTITAAPNATSTEREAQITVKGGSKTVEFTIKQSAIVTDFEVYGYENFGEFLADGESKSFNIRSTNINWTVECDANWVHISPERGSSSASVTITADPNGTSTEREAQITVKGGSKTEEFTIKQSAIVTDFEVYGYENFGEFLADGESKSFNIRSTNINWTVECDANWVHISPERGSSSASVTITADPNGTSTEREAQITVKGGPKTVEFTIKQSAIVTDFEVYGYENFGEFLADGESKSFNIRSTNINWTVECDANWVHISPERGSSSASVTITADPNNTSTEREAKITVKGGTHVVEFTIKQSGTSTDFIVTGYENFGKLLADGDSRSFSIRSTNVSWTVSSEANWVHFNPDKGSSSAQVTISVDANPGNSEREATVTVTGGTEAVTFQITQSGRVSDFSVSGYESLGTFLATGDTKTINIRSTNVSWTITTDADWVRIDPYEGSSSAQVKITADPNASSYERSATITVTGGAEVVTFTITQEGAFYQFEVTGYDNWGNFLSTGESKYFYIVTDNVDWTVTCDADWVHIDPSTGSSSARITIEADPNPADSEREAIITVTGGREPVTFAITQSGNVTNFEVTGYENFDNFLPIKNSKRFSIKSSNVSWEISCNAEWVHISPEKGSSSADVTIEVEENMGDERKADIHISASNGDYVDFTIKQDGKFSEFSVTGYEEFESFIAKGDSKSFSIRSTNVSWQVYCDEEWVHFNPSLGNSSATVTITVDSNNETSSREATITVDGGSEEHKVTFTIKQDGISTSFNVTGYEKFGKFLADGDTKEFIISSINVRWEVTSDKDWVHFRPSSGNSSATVTITVDNNPDEDDRSANIIIVDNGSKNKDVLRSFEINQNGRTFDISIIDGKKEIVLEKEIDAQAKFSFTTAREKDEWEITYEQVNWLKIDNSEGSGSATITLTATDKNNNVTPRSTTLTIKLKEHPTTSNTIEVFQRGNAYLTVSTVLEEYITDPAVLTFTVKGGAEEVTGEGRKFYIHTNTHWNVSPIGVDWLSVESTSEGDGDATVRLNASQNPYQNERSYNVRVTFKDDLGKDVERIVKITQEAYPDTATIANSLIFSIESENDTIARINETDKTIIESETGKKLNLREALKMTITPETLSNQWDFKWIGNGISGSDEIIIPQDNNTYPISVKVTYKNDPSIPLKEYSYTLYPAPKSPTKLEKKGGDKNKSNIMIATIDNSSTDGYVFGFKYGDATPDTTSNRYWQYSPGQTDDNKKWVYTQWTVGERVVKSMKEVNAVGTTQAVTRSESTQGIRPAIGTGFASLAGGKLTAHAESPVKAIITVISTNGMVVKRMEYNARRDYDEQIDFGGLAAGLYIVRCDMGAMRTEEKIVIK